MFKFFRFDFDEYYLDEWGTREMHGRRDKTWVNILWLIGLTRR